MMRRTLMISFCLLAVISGAALMQAPTAAVGEGATETLTVTPILMGAIKTATPTPLPPKPEDPRPALCSAPYQNGWEAHVVKAGDTLTALIQGLDIKELSVTQAAALNCIDDPMALPVGSVVWLPSLAASEATAEACQQLVESPDCAVQSQGVMSAQQLFQHGMMLWRADTREIWVITNDSTTMQVFDDTYIDGEADPTASPPNTFFVPKRGFGKIWAQLGGEKSVLGWGTAPEAQISLTIQAAGRVSYTTYVQLPEGAIYAATVFPRQPKGWWVKMGTA